jgi:hypothetical protein
MGDERLEKEIKEFEDAKKKYLKKTKELSEKLLEKELKKFEAAKKEYFNEMEGIRAEIKALGIALTDAKTKSNVELKALTIKIAELIAERSKISGTLSQEKGAKDTILVALDKEIKTREAKRDSITFDNRVAEDLIAKKMEEVAKKIRELNEIQGQTAEKTTILIEEKKKLDAATEAADARVVKQIANLKAQTEISIADGVKVAALIVKYDALIKESKSRQVDLGQKLEAVKKATKTQVEMDAISKDLVEKQAQLDTQLVDTGELKLIQEERDSDLNLRERAVVMREKNVLRKMKFLKEEGNG